MFWVSEVGVFGRDPVDMFLCSGRGVFGSEPDDVFLCSVVGVLIGVVFGVDKGH